VKDLKELSTALTHLAGAMAEVARVADRYIDLFRCGLCRGLGVLVRNEKQVKCDLCEGKGYQWPV
jgi:hypothetical protein